jgi:hypothetical protein
MKPKGKQQAGLKPREHSARVGGQSPGEARPENRASMAGWLRRGRLVLANRKPAAPSNRKTRQHPCGGRPQKFLWDDIWIETCRYVHDEGLPARQAELMRYLQQWCENQFGEQPADSTLKPKLRKLYAAPWMAGRKLSFCRFPPVCGRQAEIIAGIHWGIAGTAPAVPKGNPMASEIVDNRRSVPTRAAGSVEASSARHIMQRGILDHLGPTCGSARHSPGGRSFGDLVREAEGTNAG